MRDKKGRFLPNHKLHVKPFNNYTIENDIVFIKLKDKECLIDLDKLPLVNKCHWYANKNGYVRNDGMGAIHRLILNVRDSTLVDHINHNTLDNRISNLRLCTRTTNAQNQIKKDICTSKYKGVNYRKDRKYWRAYITVNKKTINLGIFKLEIEAANAYNVAAVKYFGEFACLNVINEVK